MMNGRLGRCYELAFYRVAESRILNRDSDMVLVHGVIRDTHIVGYGAVICHAWVEQNGMVWEPVTQHEMPVDAFMRFYDAEAVHRYSAREVCEFGIETGHVGPWEAMPDDQQVLLPKTINRLVKVQKQS